MPTPPDVPWTLDELRVASPCRESWDRMVGDDRARHCAACRLTVYDLSGMTRAEAEALVRAREGRICVRFYRRTDGTVLTRDCPVGLSTARWRMLRTVAGGIALSSSVLAAMTATEGCSPCYHVTMGRVRLHGRSARIPCVECNVLRPGRPNCPECGGAGARDVWVRAEDAREEAADGKEWRRRVDNATVSAHPVEANGWETARLEQRAALEMALACGPAFAAAYFGVEQPQDAQAAEALRARLRDSLRDGILEAEGHLPGSAGAK